MSSPAGAAIAAHEVTRTHYCRQPGCTNEARSDRGLHAYCTEHQAARRRAREQRPAAGSRVEAIASLAKLARRIDTLAERRRRASERYEAASLELREAEELLAAQLREIAGARGEQ